MTKNNQFSLNQDMINLQLGLVALLGWFLNKAHLRYLLHVSLHVTLIQFIDFMLTSWNLLTRLQTQNVGYGAENHVELFRK